MIMNKGVDTMKYIIYQIRSLENCKYGLMPWRIAKDSGFNIHDYEKIYTGNVEVNNKCEDITGFALERLFEKFNLKHPVDFNGHSLSVSDIVALEVEKDTFSYYYCDFLGWKSVTEIIGRKEI